MTPWRFHLCGFTLRCQLELKILWCCWSKWDEWITQFSLSKGSNENQDMSLRKICSIEWHNEIRCEAHYCVNMGSCFFSSWKVMFGDLTPLCCNATELVFNLYQKILHYRVQPHHSFSSVRMRSVNLWSWYCFGMRLIIISFHHHTNFYFIKTFAFSWFITCFDQIGHH
jgi:hypothetical protein